MVIPVIYVNPMRKAKKRQSWKKLSWMDAALMKINHPDFSAKDVISDFYNPKSIIPTCKN